MFTHVHSFDSDLTEGNALGGAAGHLRIEQ